MEIFIEILEHILRDGQPRVLEEIIVLGLSSGAFSVSAEELYDILPEVFEEDSEQDYPRFGSYRKGYEKYYYLVDNDGSWKKRHETRSIVDIITGEEW